MLNSTRRTISYPNPDFSDRPNVPAHMLNLVNALEVDLVYAQGASTVRTGRTHLEGTFFYETDTGLSYYDDGAVWRRVIGGIGQELDYAQVVSNSGLISVTTEAAAVLVINGNLVAYDGGRVKIEAFFPAVSPAAANTATFVFQKDGASIGQANMTYGSTQRYASKFEMFDTPTVGNHTYRICAFVSTSNITVNAGAGGAGTLLPAWLRVTRA